MPLEFGRLAMNRAEGRLLDLSEWPIFYDSRTWDGGYWASTNSASSPIVAEGRIPNLGYLGSLHDLKVVRYGTAPNFSYYATTIQGTFSAFWKPSGMSPTTFWNQWPGMPLTTGVSKFVAVGDQQNGEFYEFDVGAASYDTTVFSNTAGLLTLDWRTSNHASWMYIDGLATSPINWRYNNYQDSSPPASQAGWVMAQSLKEDQFKFHINGVDFTSDPNWEGLIGGTVASIHADMLDASLPNLGIGAYFDGNNHPANSPGQFWTHLKVAGLLHREYTDDDIAAFDQWLALPLP